MKTQVINAVVIGGQFVDKTGKDVTYQSGRLVVATYKGGQSPAYLALVKCPVDVARDLANYTPCDCRLYYDQYRNVIGYDLGD